MQSRVKVLFCFCWMLSVLTIAFAEDYYEEYDNSDAASTTTPTATTTTTAYLTKTTEINSMKFVQDVDDHCAGKICRNFHFDKLNEVAFFAPLTKVDITDGKSYNLPESNDYEVLIFENSTFATFPLHLFRAFKIRELDMRNCSLQFMTWDCFLGARELSILLLSHNKLTRLDSKTFGHTSKLQYLFLDNNQINSLTADTFGQLPKLRMLDLSHNKLQNLPEGIFDELPELQEIQLSHNRLKKVSEFLFQPATALTTITLDSNQLQELPENLFRFQAKLLHLDVSNNSDLEMLVLSINTYSLNAANCSLYRINIYGPVSLVDLSNNVILELYFSQLEDLTTLNLRNNKLNQIASLAQATSLETLNLADNPNLKDTPQDWQINNIQRLDLSNISMTALPIASLKAQSRLTHLNIAHNKIREINPSNFKFFERLTHFYIHDNNWNCYNLRSFMDLVIKPNGIVYIRDELDADFPGEYIDGIACMYRLEDDSDEMQMFNNQQQNARYLQQTDTDAEPSELEKLRREFKALNAFYEQKFDKAFELIEKLNQRLSVFEQMNKTMWEYVTIQV